MPDNDRPLLAVLIDADNTSPKYVGAILDELAESGTATVKRASGDWTTPQLGGWKTALKTVECMLGLRDSDETSKPGPVDTNSPSPFTFDDDENTFPISDILVIHDSTFLRLRTQDIHLWLHVANEAVLLSTGSITLDFNDLAGTTFSQRLSTWIPDISVGIVDSKSAARHRARSGEKRTVKTHAFLQTSLSLNMLNRKLDFTRDREKQQVHIQESCGWSENNLLSATGDQPSERQGRDGSRKCPTQLVRSGLRL